MADYRRAMPDLAVTVDDLVALGDVVVRRFTLRGSLAHTFLGIPADLD